MSTRKTQTLSLPPELRAFVIQKAEDAHGGNVSRYIRTLVERDVAQDGQQKPADPGVLVQRQTVVEAVVS